MEFDIYSNDDTMLYVIIGLGVSTLFAIIALFFFCCRDKKRKPEVKKTTSDAC